jgi:2,4-dienoyl-CoA reductase (NADPH2)
VVGNTLKETLEYGKALKKLGVDYLHIDSGFGFLNPKGSPGQYPLSGIRLFANSSRHLSAKAGMRAIWINSLPAPLAMLLAGFGWKYRPAANAYFAQCFREVVCLPIIANGGFQERSVIEGRLDTHCDMVAIGRPLLANPDLLAQFAAGRDTPDNPCTWCNLCCTRTAVLPLGCYDCSRFKHFPNPQDAMEAQILRWSADPRP